MNNKTKISKPCANPHCNVLMLLQPSVALRRQYCSVKCTIACGALGHKPGVKYSAHRPSKNWTKRLAQIRQTTKDLNGFNWDLANTNFL